MAIKHYKPTTNGRRGMTTLLNEEITINNAPTKSLLKKVNKTGGRNNQGKMTVRHIGGGAKRKYRLIDYKRNKTIFIRDADEIGEIIKICKDNDISYDGASIFQNNSDIFIHF